MRTKTSAQIALLLCRLVDKRLSYGDDLESARAYALGVLRKITGSGVVQ